MDRNINSEVCKSGETKTFALSAEVSRYLSSMTHTSLLRFSPSSISNIAGSNEKLSYGNLNKNVFTGNALSGDIMLGVADLSGTRQPYLLLFRKENNADYAYDLYSLPSLAPGTKVVQCLHLDSNTRSSHSRYLPAIKYLPGRDAMPINSPIEVSRMSEPQYSCDFSTYLSSAMDTAKSKLS